MNKFRDLFKLELTSIINLTTIYSLFTTRISRYSPQPLRKCHDQQISYRHYEYDTRVVIFLYVLQRNRSAGYANCIDKTIFVYYLIVQARVKWNFLHTIRNSVFNKKEIMNRKTNSR